MLNPYLLKEHDEYSFEFVTDHGIRYVVYFLDYSTMFSGYPEISSPVFMFNIDVIEGNPDESISDERIGQTIMHVFNLFFKTQQNVAVYVCDTLDSRHLSRKRKFDIWFWKYNDGSLIKEDDLAIIDGTEIYNSMVLHKQNKDIKELIIAFKELNEKAREK